MGEVIPITVKYVDADEERMCSLCRYALQGPTGIYCRVYHVDVIDEIEEAEICEDYDP